MRSLYARLQRRYGSRVSGSERQRQASRHRSKLRQRFPIDDWLIASKRRPRQLRPALAVVGAGFAGLMAGFLLAHDFKVVVLEARRRVGGRVHSVWDGTGRVTEAGGELIGYAHAFGMRLIRLGLSVLTREDDYAAQNLELPMQIGGQFLSPARQEALYRVVAGAASRDHPDGYFKFTENVSDRIGMTWEATDNQMRGRNQNIHINLFAGGDSARRALRVFERADLAAMHAFYDRGLGRIYKNYASSRAPDPRFVPWPLERWT
jgi:phytoene dehydrogenase-like protein